VRHLAWADRWSKELSTGQYYDLLQKGFFDKRPEHLEPNIGGFEFYFDAFRELSTCRPSGLDLAAIPFTAIVDYSRIYELGDFEDFIYIIRAMDNEFLRLHYLKSKTKGTGDDATRKPDKKNSRNG
jgi:hypothetical protein